MYMQNDVAGAVASCPRGCLPHGRAALNWTDCLQSGEQSGLVKVGQK